LAPNEPGVTFNRHPAPLRNLTRHRSIAARVLRAVSLWERGAGLLALPPLQAGEALWLEPCGSIHTWGMRYAIDVVFLSRELRVLAVWRNVRPWGIAWAPRGTQIAVELLAGGAAEVARGDLLSTGG
jgi:hypothetical protein